MDGHFVQCKKRFGGFLLLLLLLRLVGSEPEAQSPSGMKLQKDTFLCQHTFYQGKVTSVRSIFQQSIRFTVFSVVLLACEAL